MSWDGLPLTATCDLADPGWESAEAPTPVCDLSASEMLYGIEEDTLLDSGYDGTPGGWTVARMESVCDG